MLKPTLCENQCRNGEHHQVTSQSRKQNTRSLFLQQNKDASGFLHFVLESNSMNENVRILATKTVAFTRRKPGMIKGASNNCYMKPSTLGCHCFALPSPVPQVAKRSDSHNPPSLSPAWPHQPSSALPPQPSHLSCTLLETACS